MTRTAALLAAATALFALLPGARAETLACQTVNGQTMCLRGSGSLSCQSVNGQTLCRQGPGALHCRTAGERTVCSDEAAAAPPPLPPDAAEPSGREVSVMQDGGRLQVRAGGVEVRID